MSTAPVVITEEMFFAMNNRITQKAGDGFPLIELDQKALSMYLQYVNDRTLKFGSPYERMIWLVENNYYRRDVVELYSEEEINQLDFMAREYGFYYKSFMQAFKFFEEYALKSDDKEQWLEDFEEHNVIISMVYAKGNMNRAIHHLKYKMLQCAQPATPTFLNMGRVRSGKWVSCFLLSMEDTTESIQHNLTAIANLSRIGGGLAFEVSNLRAMRDPIKGIVNAAKGPLGVLKIAEDELNFYNQLGQREGSGAGYISIFHPDCNRILDAKKINADDNVRLKSLSLGVTIPQVFYDLAEENKPFYTFSPYEIEKFYGMQFNEVDFDEMYYVFLEDSRITKHTCNLTARDFWNKIAQIQFQSGYPYIVNISNANKMNPLKNLGRIIMSNLCTEIFQIQETSTIKPYFEPDIIKRDVLCTLESLNITNVMESKSIAESVRIGMDELTFVSDNLDIDTVPGVKMANDELHAVGLGAMDLHGFLAKNHINYESFEARDFARTFFMMMNYYSIERSMQIAKDRKQKFKGFEKSDYASGEYFVKYRNIDYFPRSEKVKNLFEGIYIPSTSDWDMLMLSVQKYGLYHAYRLAIAPTQSISYVQNATSSVMPVVDAIEKRLYGKGAIYYPAPHYARDNKWYFKTAYRTNMYKLIDMVAVIQEHIDQGISTILYVDAEIPTNELARLYLYANKKGLKALYYTRVNRKGVKAPVGQNTECLECSV